MKLKINAHFLFIAFLSMLLTAGLCVSVFHGSFQEQTKTDIRLNGHILAKAYSHLDSIEQLEEFADQEFRITLIASDGTVLFESNANKNSMENHIQRPEVASAMETGEGECIRSSVTSGYDTYYYAVLLSDGNVLRVSINVDNLYLGYRKTLPAIFLIGAAMMALSAVLSIAVTKKIVRPIEEMADNLDEIHKHVPYPELQSFAKAVQQHQEKKKEVEQMRQDFTANVSHELKTPMTSISGYAEMIENGMAKEDDIKEFAGKIHSEAARLMTLVGDIIKLSELDDPTTIWDAAPVDLLELAKNTAELLTLPAQRAKVTITVKGDPCMVRGNATMLDEMLYNLCDNAIRYNKKGGNVEVSVADQGPYIRLTVSDTGIGIPEEHTERVFERFYRVDKSRSKQTGGTGLGLAIVKHIVMRHDGKIDVESVVGQGTDIRVWFKKCEDRENQ